VPLLHQPVGIVPEFCALFANNNIKAIKLIIPKSEVVLSIIGRVFIPVQSIILSPSTMIMMTT